MEQNYTYRYRLYPTDTQKVLLEKHFGCTRFVFNHFLDKRIQFYLNTKEQDVKKKSLNYYDNANELVELKKEFLWLREVNSQALQASLSNLDLAYNKFFKKESGFPNFKSKHKRNSFRVPQWVTVKDDTVYIPKFKEGIKFTMHRLLEGAIRFCSISKTPAGQYYVCFSVTKNIEVLPEVDKITGIDLGVKTLVTQSDGTIYPNAHFTKQYEKKLRKEQRRLARKRKGSKNREKQRVKVARVHQKIDNCRSNHLHQISHKIIHENQVVILEDLHVKGMLRNHCLAKSISDCSWSELIRQISYKASWYGREVVEIGRFFPSSKTCHVCGYVKEDLQLSDREWVCPRCGTKHDRDLNAAKTIKQQGLNLMNSNRVGTTRINASGDSASTCSRNAMGKHCRGKKKPLALARG